MVKKNKAKSSPGGSPFGVVSSAVGGLFQRLSKKKNGGPTPPAISNLKTIGGCRPDDSIYYDDQWDQKEELSLPGDDDEEKEEEKVQLTEDINYAGYQDATDSFDEMELGSSQQLRTDVLDLFSNLSVSNQKQAVMMMQKLLDKQVDDHVSITE